MKTSLSRAIQGAARIDVPEFVPRPPWLGGDLQTLRNTLVRRPVRLSPWPRRELLLPMADGSGDRLAATLQQPAEDRGRPLVVLIHGLSGCEGSSYMRAAARYLLCHGYPVLRLNQRGAGPSRPLCRFQYHAGRSEDLRDALRAVAEIGGGLLRHGVALVGFSLGGNVLLKFLAEQVREFPVRAAVSVSAPIDLKATQDRLLSPRNRPYHDYLLTRVKVEGLARASEVTYAERRAIWRASSLYEFDDLFIAPRNGFEGARDYYLKCSARHFIEEIEVPTLFIHALDDPWIPAEPYLSVDWAKARHLVPLLPASGGHVGFHGRGSPIPWHNRAIGRFFEEVLA